MKWRAVGFVLTVAVVLAMALEVDSYTARTGAGTSVGTRLVVHWRHVPGWAWAIVALGILVLPVLIGVAFPEKTTDSATVPAPTGKMWSRSLAFALGVAAGVLATILVIAYRNYRERFPVAPNAPTPVLVAKQLIPKGTPGTVIATGPMYAPTTLPKKEREDGAILDPQWLSGREAAVDIFPGQQFTESDFMPRQLSDAGHGG